MTTATTKAQDLTPLDKAGIDFYATLFSSFGVLEEEPLVEMSGEIREAMTVFLAENRLLARFLGAAVLEHMVWGDRDFGEDDPPVDEFLGRAIDRVIEDLTPLVRHLHPAFFTDIESQA